MFSTTVFGFLQHYAKILDKRVSDDMQALRNKFKSALKIADSKTGS